MDVVLTLIVDPAKPSLDETMVSRARTALSDAGAAVAATDWLAPGIACDLKFSGLPILEADAAVKPVIDGTEVDGIVQSTWDRKKRLLVADMDSTIVTAETLDELAAKAGIGEQIAAITKRAMNGELGFAEALRARVSQLDGIDTALLMETYNDIRLMPGARELVGTMRQYGAFTALVSGGFTFFTSRVKKRLGFDYQEANILDEEDGLLTGRVIEPILSPDRKLAALMQIAANAGLGLERTLAVGDGANDIKMLAAAGLGIAYRAKPLVRDTIRTRVDHGDLTALLYAQGYRAHEIVSA